LRRSCGKPAPVGTGLVRSLARPGGNATGFTAFEYSLAGKWLEMLKEIAPPVTRVAVLFNPETAPFAQQYLSFIETSAPTFGVTANAASIGSISEIEAAIEAQARASGGGLIVLPDTLHLLQSCAPHCTGGTLPPPGHLRDPWPGRRRRLAVLWVRPGRSPQARGWLRRSHPQRREAGRPAGAGADQVRAGD